MNCSRKNNFVLRNNSRPSNVEVERQETNKRNLQSPVLSGLKYPITFTKKQANEARVNPGAYEITGTIQNRTGEAKRIEDVDVSVPIDGKEYPVQIVSFDVSEPYEYSGDYQSDYKLKAVIPDAPVNSDYPLNSAFPVGPVVWAGSAVASLGAGWLFVDKLQKFASSGTGTLITLAGVGLAAYSVLRKK
jgi:hypothetical protein